MKSIVNSVSLWLSIAMFTYAPFAVASSSWSWICTCDGVAAFPVSFAVCPRSKGMLPPRPCMAGAAEPLSLGGGDLACLLLHGLTGSPAEVRPVGEALAKAGFRAVGPLLPGHGTTPRDLMRVGRADMLAAAADALRSLGGARRVFACGLSMGALLSVELCARVAARDGAPAITAIALLASAVRMGPPRRLFPEGVGRLPPLSLILGDGVPVIAGGAARRDEPA